MRSVTIVFIVINIIEQGKPMDDAFDDIQSSQPAVLIHLSKHQYSGFCAVVISQCMGNIEQMSITSSATSHLHLSNTNDLECLRRVDVCFLNAHLGSTTAATSLIVNTTNADNYIGSNCSTVQQKNVTTNYQIAIFGRNCSKQRFKRAVDQKKPGSMHYYAPLRGHEIHKISTFVYFIAIIGITAYCIIVYSMFCVAEAQHQGNERERIRREMEFERQYLKERITRLANRLDEVDSTQASIIAKKAKRSQSPKSSSNGQKSQKKQQSQPVKSELCSPTELESSEEQISTASQQGTPKRKSIYELAVAEKSEPAVRSSKLEKRPIKSRSGKPSRKSPSSKRKHDSSSKSRTEGFSTKSSSSDRKHDSSRMRNGKFSKKSSSSRKKLETFATAAVSSKTQKALLVQPSPKASEKSLKGQKKLKCVSKSCPVQAGQLLHQKPVIPSPSWHKILRDLKRQQTVMEDSNLGQTKKIMPSTAPRKITEDIPDETDQGNVLKKTNIIHINISDTGDDDDEDDDDDNESFYRSARDSHLGRNKRIKALPPLKRKPSPSRNITSRDIIQIDQAPSADFITQISASRASTDSFTENKGKRGEAVPVPVTVRPPRITTPFQRARSKCPCQRKSAAHERDSPETTSTRKISPSVNPMIIQRAREIPDGMETLSRRKRALYRASPRQLADLERALQDLSDLSERDQERMENNDRKR